MSFSIFFLELLKRPQRWFLRWFGGPNLLAAISSIRSFRNGSVGNEGPTRVRYSPHSEVPPSSLDDLQGATTEDWLWVPLAQIRSLRGQIFSREQHPYVRYFHYGFEGLREYFDFDEPKNISSFFFIEDQIDLEPKSPLQTSGIWPWSNIAVRFAAPDPSIWRAGPKSDDDLAAEARRLDRILASVERNGFMIKQGELPQYFLLLRDSAGEIVDFRAIVAKGKHRVAALAYLGWELIPMEPTRAYMQIEVRLSEIARWPGVVNGTFSIEEATAIFLSFFQ